MNTIIEHTDQLLIKIVSMRRTPENSSIVIGLAKEVQREFMAAKTSASIYQTNGQLLLAAIWQAKALDLAVRLNAALDVYATQLALACQQCEGPTIFVPHGSTDAYLCVTCGKQMVPVDA